MTELIVTHSSGHGGGNIESVIFFGGLALLGVIMAVTRSAKPAVAATISLLGVAGVVASITLFKGSPAADLAVQISSPAAGDEVPAGEPLRVEVEVEHGTIATSPQDTDSPHLHVFVDGELDSMPYTTSPEIRLEPGDHEITVELVDGEHAAYDPPVRDSVEVTAS